MTTCLIVAAIIACTGTTPRQTPAEAVKVFTASVQPYVAPPRLEGPTLVVVGQSPTFPTPATPIRPLSEPWSVTTFYAWRGGISTFNGRPFVEATRDGVPTRNPVFQYGQRWHGGPGGHGRAR